MHRRWRSGEWRLTQEACHRRCADCSQRRGPCRRKLLVLRAPSRDVIVRDVVEVGCRSGATFLRRNGPLRLTRDLDLLFLHEGVRRTASSSRHGMCHGPSQLGRLEEASWQLLAGQMPGPQCHWLWKARLSSITAGLACRSAAAVAMLTFRFRHVRPMRPSGALCWACRHLHTRTRDGFLLVLLVGRRDGAEGEARGLLNCSALAGSECYQTCGCTAQLLMGSPLRSPGRER